MPVYGRRSIWCEWKLIQCIFRCLSVKSPSRDFSNRRLSRRSWLLSYLLLIQPFPLKYLLSFGKPHAKAFFLPTVYPGGISLPEIVTHQQSWWVCICGQSPKILATPQGVGTVWHSQRAYTHRKAANGQSFYFNWCAIVSFTRLLIQAFPKTIFI